MLLTYDEFAGKHDEDTTGDVKYHMGYSADVAVDNGDSVHLSLLFNPSHLDFIDPVLLGSVRGRQDRNDPLGNKADYALGIMLMEMPLMQAKVLSWKHW